MNMKLETDFAELEKAVRDACAKMDDLRRQRDLLARALEGLLEAMPTSCDDRRLNEAQREAEQLLEVLSHA